MKKKPFIHKRSFLLLELLISFALLTLCLFPLVKPHLAIYTSEKTQLKKMQLAAHAETAFCRIKEILHDGKTYSWVDLHRRIEGTLPDCSIQISADKKATYTCRYVLEKLDESHHGSVKALLLDVSLFFKCNQEESSFSHTLYLEREGV